MVKADRQTHRQTDKLDRVTSSFVGGENKAEMTLYRSLFWRRDTVATCVSLDFTNSSDRISTFTPCRKRQARIMVHEPGEMLFC